MYNAKEGTDYNAETFFNEITFPLFFNDDRHLMHVHGSTFFQSIDNEKIKIAGSEPLARLRRLHQDITDKKISGSIYVGYAAGEATAVTSGQVSNIEKLISDEEIYASWIGQCLAIGLKGGLLLFDDNKIFDILYQGWTVYRNLLNQTPNLKPRQIETWNGQWLSYYTKQKDLREVEKDNFSLEVDLEQNNSILSIPTVSWAKIVFSLCKLFSNKCITTHAYVMSKTNSTYGFINLFLPEINKYYELRNKLFLPEQLTVLKEEEIENLSTYYSFNAACRMGIIALKALEPNKLRDFMPEPIGKNKEYKFTNEESYKKYQLFKLWIIAMINKTELLESATKLATILIEIDDQGNETNRGKSGTSQKIKEFLNVKNIREFTDILTEFLDLTAKSENIRTALIEVLKMPSDLFPLFITLIRFEYNYLNKTK
ncbi:MAG: hypothetical protein MI922_15340 [Bacteroidales bacterium]|nr:hypothetical protein [Bacteroidales bacterium]